MSALTDMLVRHEGMKLKLYQDTVGKWTIGVGRNLSDMGIRPDEAELLLDNDVAAIQGDLRRMFPWFSMLDPVRQDALTDMAFNLGISRFSGFHQMLAACEQRQWELAAEHGLESVWATQVGHRANELMDMMRTGQYQV